MINVEEHIYRDDPKIGHPDVRTQLKDVCYYFIGNGLISAAVQHAPAGEGSPYGLLVMDPEQLKSKRETLSFDPETGVERTMLFLTIVGAGAPLERHDLSVSWDFCDGLPCVRAHWCAAALEVTELFYCPDRSSARLAREIRVRNGSAFPTVCTLETGLQARSIAQPLDLAPGGEQELFVIYALDPSRLMVHFEFVGHRPAMQKGIRHWSGAARVHFDSPMLDHLYQSAAAQLPSMVSRTGRIDAGIWQYNREWVRDQSIMAHALVLCGHPQIARVILERQLREFVSAEGSTVDSSVVRDPADAELDQNGVLLQALREYTLWTGDLSLVKSNWDALVRTAEFPLQESFREPTSGLMFNQREFWERHSVYGIEPGLELTHQVYVSAGLAAASALARQIGKSVEADRWQAEAARLKQAILRHPTHALVTENGFTKRRGIDGSIQEFIVPRPDAGLPKGVGLADRISHPLNPDSSCALPIVLGFVPPESQTAQATLEQLEALWNQGWEIGGYGRYHMDSDPDSPGPWPFPSIYIARAYMECRNYPKVWRVIRWLASLPQYPSGSFFEMYGNRIAPPYAQNGIVPWNWAEMILLVTQNILGFQPEEDAIRMRPRLLPGLEGAQGSLPFRNRRIFFTFRRDAGIALPRFMVNSFPFEADGETARIPFAGLDLYIEASIPDSVQASLGYHR